MTSARGQEQIRAGILAAVVALAAGLLMLASAPEARAAWGTPVFGNGPYGIATDGSGNLYVTERTGNRVVKYSATGTQLMAFGAPGNGQAQFNSPGGLAVESGGAIFVADTGTAPFGAQLGLESEGFQVGSTDNRAVASRGEEIQEIADNAAI